MRATNRGSTSLKLRRRSEDPMRTYDALPAPIRRWLSQAALPWSPASCRKILRRGRGRGKGLDQILARLEHAQQATLARDRAAFCRNETKPAPATKPNPHRPRVVLPLHFPRNPRSIASERNHDESSGSCYSGTCRRRAGLGAGNPRNGRA